MANVKNEVLPERLFAKRQIVIAAFGACAAASLLLLAQSMYELAQLSPFG